jgi:hypothetical protein
VLSDSGCLSDAVVSGTSAQGLSVSYGDCIELAYSGVAGCTDDSACNYDADATDDDGSCSYAEENYDCDGNCTAPVDDCGVCGGDGSSCDISVALSLGDAADWTDAVGGCTDMDACNYDADATDDDGSCS